MTQTPDATFLTKLAKIAAEVHLRHFDKLDPADIDLKRRRDLLTVADSEAERELIREIKSSYPGHDILAEESGAQVSGAEWCWIIDPVDGTTNFARGFPMFSASIGLVRRGLPVLGLVEAAYLRETFIAERGAGAFLNGRRLSVSRTPDIHTSLLATGFSYVRNEVTRNNVDNFGKLVLKCHDIRRGGSASVDLAYVAAGRFDGYWEGYLKPWDVAAGALLVQEAGGAITDFAGGQDWLFGENAVATNGMIHAELLGELSGTEPGYQPWGREIERKLRGG
jgi:myo-inositol-1(or 4)-monophosphatase